MDKTFALGFKVAELLVASRERLLEKEGLELVHLPATPLWKELGDELVFVAELTHLKQAEGRSFDGREIQSQAAPVR